MYADIVFFCCESENAQEVETILREQGEQTAMDYMAQWDNGEIVEVYGADSLPFGRGDTLYKSGIYIMVYSLHGEPHFNLVRRLDPEEETMVRDKGF